VEKDLTFPAPKGINVNMMPFIMGDRLSIPEELRGYWPIIEQCSGSDDNRSHNIPSSKKCPSCHRSRMVFSEEHIVEDCEFCPEACGGPAWHCLHCHAKVCTTCCPPLKSHAQKPEVWYLTIQEGLVPKGTTQRRPGLHIDGGGLVLKEGGRWSAEWLNWGEVFEEFTGGIYMASNVSNTCKVWNVRVKDQPEVCGPNGSLEHLREIMPEGRLLEEGELVWITDTTPHESVPLDEEVRRQFIRVVTKSVSVWYEQHSTKNPKGVVPDPAVTAIVAHDKFAPIGADAASSSGDAAPSALGPSAE